MTDNKKTFYKKFFILLLFSPAFINNSFAQSAKPVVKAAKTTKTTVKVKPSATIKPIVKPSSSANIKPSVKPLSSPSIKPAKPSATPVTSSTPIPSPSVDDSIDLGEIYKRKPISPSPKASTSVSSEIPLILPSVSVISSPSPQKEIKTEDKFADDVDISTFSYIDNMEASAEFFNLIINSSCGKSPENCNNNDALTKIAKQIIDEINKKYPVSGKTFTEEKTRYFLMNSITLKDRLGQDNLSKLTKIKDDLKAINDSVFKEKREDIIKRYMNAPQIVQNPIMNSDNSSLPIPTPTPSTDNSKGRVAFVSERDGNPEIYTMNPDGSNQTRITNNDVYDQMPSWSPDGTKIIFVSERDGNPEIYTMNSDGSNVVRLTNNSSYDYSPVFSPDGSKILFVSNRENIQSAGSPVARLGFKIFIMNADGTDQKPLFPDSVGDESPSWSPDGKKIVFVSKRDGNPEIYVCDADGTNVVRLTNSPTFDMMPAWSPDGSKIAFRSDRDGNPEIYTMNPDGTDLKRITRNLSSDEYPTWSPDSTKLIFVSRRDNIKDESGDFVNEIYVMNADSSNIFRLTKNESDDYQPSWYGKP